MEDIVKKGKGKGKKIYLGKGSNNRTVKKGDNKYLTAEIKLLNKLLEEKKLENIQLNGKYKEIVKKYKRLKAGFDSDGSLSPSRGRDLHRKDKKKIKFLKDNIMDDSE